jgi:hypothetical protein
MARFASREEYEAWKASQGGAAPSGPASRPPVAARAAAPDVGPLPTPPPAAPAKKKEGLKEAFSGLPGWAWPFVVACFAIPVVSVGGALPTGLGFGAAAGVAQVAKKPEWETMPKVLVSAAIAGGAWILFLALVAALASR